MRDRITPRRYWNDGEEWRWLVNTAYDYPMDVWPEFRYYRPWTISQAIEKLTGFRVEYDNVFQRIAPWYTVTMESYDQLPTAFRRNGKTYYYDRDVLLMAGPCPRCEACGSHPSRYSWRLDKVTCGRFCWDATKMWKKGGWSGKEFDKFCEHQAFVTCSQECHDTLAKHYYKTTNDLARTRQWLRTSATQLSELKRVLRPHDRRLNPKRHHSISPDVVCEPAAISAI